MWRDSPAFSFLQAMNGFNVHVTISDILKRKGTHTDDTLGVSGSNAAQAVVWDALRLAQEVVAGREQAGGELSALQRGAQLAAEPLIALGKSVAATAIGYLGSSTAVALASGLGVLRLGLGALATLDSAGAASGKLYAWAVGLCASGYCCILACSSMGRSRGPEPHVTLPDK